MSLIKIVKASILFVSYKGPQAKANANERIRGVARATIADFILEKNQKEFGRNLFDRQSVT